MEPTMKPFVDIVVETSNLTGALNRLHSLGLEKGNGIRLYTCTLESVSSLLYFTFRVWQDRVHVIPDNNNPVFTILWRSDRQDPPVPWPEVEVNVDDGINPPYTRMQGIGRIC